MTKKKPTKKKAKKKTGPFDAKPKTVTRILAQIEVTQEIETILEGNEAKLYLTGIDRARAKLQSVIDREMALRRHPGHSDHPKG